MLRLWQAQAYISLDLQAFNVGDYRRAVEEKALSENITKVLYPNDDSEAGKLLRLQQQYFFISCSLQDMIRIYEQHEKTMDRFHEKYAIQLNDTHPSLAVAELMRILVDERGDALGDGVGNHHQDSELHQPHPHARGAGNLALAPDAEAAASARGDHFRDQPALPQRDPPALPQRRRAPRAHVPDRRARRAPRTHGPPGHRGQPCRQRRGQIALGSLARDRAARLRRDLAREVQQQDQRHHAAPVPHAGQPGPDLAHHRGHRGQVDRRPDPPARPGEIRRRRRLRRKVAQGQARQQARLGRISVEQVPTAIRPPSPCSTCRSSASTSTSAST